MRVSFILNKHLSPAFLHLNLAYNPFGELNKPQRQQLACVDLKHLLPLFKTQRFALQFNADHGRGKTTHLLALHALFPDAPYIKLHIDDKPAIPRAPLVFIDSIEHLGFFKRLQVFTRCQQLVFTTHKDLAWQARCTGLALHNEQVSISLCQLHQALNKRIEFARLSDGVIPEISLDCVKQLKRQYGDDVRAMEAFLYDYFQNLDCLKDVEL